MPTSIWWVRDDLRLHDNPALAAAAETGDVIAVHIDEEIPGARAPGAATRWWLHHSLGSLSAGLRAYGVPLLLLNGDPREVLPHLIEETGARAVLWNRRYHDPKRAVDGSVKASLRAAGVHVESFGGYLLHEPWRIRTKNDAAYQVFTPFANACRDAPPPREAGALPADLRGPAGGARAGGHEVSAWMDEGHVTRELERRGWLPTAPDWAGGLRETWQPGETGARTRLSRLDDVLADYDEKREFPGRGGTSGLSAHLRFGEVSPHEVWHRSRDAGRGKGAEAFRTQLLWREFAWHRLFRLPDLATRNVRPQFDRFAWRDDHCDLKAWQQGRTGIDLVDAGMRELWRTGWMHNRVRMVVASFLTKNLRLHWRCGEEWFWDTLVDADEASNPFNWQWVAGTGDDAAPYFRIFNPERQQERFDGDRDYVARWVPEALDRSRERRPRIVDLRGTREEALAAYAAIRRD